MTDAALAAALAEAAGRIVLAVRADGLLDGRSLGDAADAIANRYILAALAAHRPDDAILCEECPDTPARLSRERVWIIDPLDGTREFSEGRADWAVHVALAVNGTPCAGAVALPDRPMVLRSDATPPAPTVRPAHPRIVVSRTRPPAIAGRVATALDGELIAMGSAGAKAAAALTGEAEIYFHDGGQHEWDNCAPVAVALAAGFTATRLDGTPLAYNQPDPRLPDLLICAPAWAAPLRAALDYMRTK